MDLKNADPVFLKAGINHLRYRDQEWFDVGRMSIRMPRLFAQAGLVVIGMSKTQAVEQFRSCSSWLAVVEQIDDIDFQLLQRLGVQNNYLAIVVFNSACRKFLTNSADIEFGASLIVFDGSSGSTRLFGDQLFKKHLANYLENKNVGGAETLLFVNEQTVNNNGFSHEHMVTYPKSAFLSDKDDQWMWFSNQFANLPQILLAKGSVRSSLIGLRDGLKMVPNAYFLERFSGEGALCNASYVEIRILEGKLMVRGYHVTEYMPTDHFYKNVHYLLLESKKDQVKIELGQLKREILQAVPISSFASNNLYGAFTLPNHSPIELSEYVDGAFKIRVTDKKGYDLISNGLLSLEIDEVSRDAGFRLEKRDGYVLVSCPAAN